MTLKDRIQIFENSMSALETMHGSVTGDPQEVPPHEYDPHKCHCVYGETLRGLKELRAEARLLIKKNKARRKS